MRVIAHWFVKYPDVYSILCTRLYKKQGRKRSYIRSKRQKKLNFWRERERERGVERER